MTLPQPPPGVEAPPPSVQAINSRAWRNVIVAMVPVSLLLLVLLAPLLGPLFLTAKSKGPLMQSANNIRQVGLAMTDFMTEYGRFPDASTIAAVQSTGGTAIPLGTKSSNDFLRQLMVSEIVKNEAIFYAPINGAKFPNGDMAGANAIAKGECGFSYILGALSTDANRPLLITPLFPGTTRFDPKPLYGQAVIWRADGVVLSLPIDSSGNVSLDGKPLFDPANPVWDGRPPVIAWPE